MLSIHSPEHFMKEALKEAKIAFEKGEVPVGAVVVCNHRIIGRGHNLTESLQDPTGHAEIMAITAACEALGSKYLEDCDLFVTLEPCIMCAGACYWAQLKNVYYAANDDKKGYSQYEINPFHPKTTVHTGLLENDSVEILKTFFKQLRS